MFLVLHTTHYNGLTLTEYTRTPILNENNLLNIMMMVKLPTLLSVSVYPHHAPSFDAATGYNVSAKTTRDIPCRGQKN